MCWIYSKSFMYQNHSYYIEFKQVQQPFDFIYFEHAIMWLSFITNFCRWIGDQVVQHIVDWSSIASLLSCIHRPNLKFKQVTSNKLSIILAGNLHWIWNSEDTSESCNHHQYNVSHFNQQTVEMNSSENDFQRGL